MSPWKRKKLVRLLRSLTEEQRQRATKEILTIIRRANLASVHKEEGLAENDGIPDSGSNKASQVKSHRR